jgi:hypothetical protein
MRSTSASSQEVERNGRLGLAVTRPSCLTAFQVFVTSSSGASAAWRGSGAVELLTTAPHGARRAVVSGICERSWVPGPAATPEA